jgi:hypothetical protein
MKQKHLAKFVDVETGELFPDNTDKVIKEDLNWRELQLLNDHSSSSDDEDNDLGFD